MTEIIKALEELRKNSKKRNFVQRVDLIINLRGIDTRKPENRINETLELPYAPGKEAKIAIFSDEIKDLEEVKFFTSKDLEEIGKNKRMAKKISKEFDFFLTNPKLLSLVAKNMGKFLAPKGKTPKPISGDVKKLIESLKKSVRIRIKDSPVIQVPVGNENMKNEEIEKNIRHAINFIAEKLPKKKNNIKEILVKFTMSKPVKVEVKL